MKQRKAESDGFGVQLQCSCNVSCSDSKKCSRTAEQLQNYQWEEIGKSLAAILYASTPHIGFQIEHDKAYAEMWMGDYVNFCITSAWKNAKSSKPRHACQCSQDGRGSTQSHWRSQDGVVEEQCDQEIWHAAAVSFKGLCPSNHKPSLK